MITRFFSPKRALLRFFLIFFASIIIFYSWFSGFSNSEKSKIFLLFDNSLSMSVQDIVDEETGILHSRISVAKDFAKNFIENYESDADFAISSFSSNLVLESPFSPDKILANNVISGISTINYGGWSNIFQALETFSKIYKNTKNINIIVFSDMEFFDENTISPTLSDSNKIFNVAIGTTSGWNMILGYDASGRPIYKEFKSEIAISKLSISSIQDFSKKTNSPYFIVSSKSSFSDFSKNIKNFLQKNSNSNFSILLFLAYLALFMAIFINIYPYDKIKN